MCVILHKINIFVKQKGRYRLVAEEFDNSATGDLASFDLVADLSGYRRSFEDGFPVLAAKSERMFGCYTTTYLCTIYIYLRTYIYIEREAEEHRN